MRFNLNLVVTAAFSAILGAVVFWSVNNSQAQVWRREGITVRSDRNVNNQCWGTVY